MNKRTNRAGIILLFFFEVGALIALGPSVVPRFQIDAGSGQSCTPTAWDQSLRTLAACAGIQIGTAVRPALLREEAYASTLAREFNLLEPEDALKWEVLHPQPNTFDFSDGDRIVAFAELHGMKVRGHTLIWTHQNPPWLVHGTFSQAELHSLLYEHIQQVMGHYRGRIFAWMLLMKQLTRTDSYEALSGTTSPGSGWQTKERPI